MAVRLPMIEQEPTTHLEAGACVGDLLRVGDLAQRTRKTVRALHLYEELGLLHPSERSKGGFRLYGEDATLRVRWISKLQDMGFSLPEIREVLAQWERSGSATGAMSDIQRLYKDKLAETERQIDRLKSLRDELAASVDYLETCEICDPVRLISSCPRCELHACGTPDLVAGLHGAASSNDTTPRAALAPRGR